MPEYTNAPHTFVKDGVFYFVRRVPRDLAHHYRTSKISHSLRTRSPSVAAARATRAAQRLDEYWYRLRLANADLPGKHLLRLGMVPAPVVQGPGVTKGKAKAAVAPEPEEGMRLSEAVAVYLRLKGRGRPVTFRRSAERSCGYVIDVCGDKPIGAYVKADANAFRDALVAKGVKRRAIRTPFPG